MNAAGRGAAILVVATFPDIFKPVPDSLLSASKASRQVAGQIGLPVGSAWRRLSAHSVALARSCEGLRLKCCC